MCDVSFTEIEHRRVARALYWHVENRTSLINLMAATFSEAANRDKERAHGWRNKLLVFARALRRAMLIHRDFARRLRRHREDDFQDMPF